MRPLSKSSTLGSLLLSIQVYKVVGFPHLTLPTLVEILFLAVLVNVWWPDLHMHHVLPGTPYTPSNNNEVLPTSWSHPNLSLTWVSAYLSLPRKSFFLPPSYLLMLQDIAPPRNCHITNIVNCPWPPQCWIVIVCWWGLLFKLGTTKNEHCFYLYIHTALNASWNIGVW